MNASECCIHSLVIVIIIIMDYVMLPSICDCLIDSYRQEADKKQGNATKVKKKVNLQEKNMKNEWQFFFQQNDGTGMTDKSPTQCKVHCCVLFK